jgi:hypothetical protein
LDADPHFDAEIAYAEITDGMVRHPSFSASSLERACGISPRRLSRLNQRTKGRILVGAQVRYHRWRCLPLGFS